MEDYSPVCPSWRPCTWGARASSSRMVKGRSGPAKPSTQFLALMLSSCREASRACSAWPIRASREASAKDSKCRSRYVLAACRSGSRREQCWLRVRGSQLEESLLLYHPRNLRSRVRGWGVWLIRGSMDASKKDAKWCALQVGLCCLHACWAGHLRNRFCGAECAAHGQMLLERSLCKAPCVHAGACKYTELQLSSACDRRCTRPPRLQPR